MKLIWTEEKENCRTMILQLLLKLSNYAEHDEWD